MSDFIPNSFQHPNSYIDEYMHLLTGEEFKVLTYAVRRIFGFNKRQDRISLSQFVSGTVSREDGRQLDNGTGLSLQTVKKCLTVLTNAKLIIKEGNNDPKVNEGCLYSLQLDSKKVNLAWLCDQQAKRTARAGEKMASARKAKAQKGKEAETPSIPQTPIYGIEGGGVNGIEGTPIYGIETQNTDQTQKKPNGADAPGVPGSKPTPRPLTERQKILATLEQSFSTYTGLPLPRRKTDKDKKAASTQWWGPLWAIYELVGKHPEQADSLMRYAIKDMATNKLHIKSPKSIEGVALSIYAKRKAKPSAGAIGPRQTAPLY